MIRLKATPESVKQAQDFLRRMTNAVQPNPRDLEPVRQAIRAGFALNFDTESDAGAEKWALLSKRTQRERVALGYPAEHPILQRSGSYRGSFTDPANPYHVSETTIGSVMIRLAEGTADPRADELEAGENLLIPARPASDLGAASVFLLEEALADLYDRLFPRQ